MPTYDYVCPEGHVFDGLYREDEKVVPCRVCNGEPGIARGYTELQLRMAKVFALQVLHEHENLDLHFESMGMLTPNQGWHKKAYRCLLAMPSWMRRNANPLNIVVHRDPRTGEYRFPAHASAPVPSGFEKVEVDSAAKARKIERQVREREETKAREYQYAQAAQRDALLKPKLDDLRAKMGGMSKFGQDLAKVAIENAQKKSAEKSRIHVPDMGIGFEVLNLDKGNRDGHADKETGWKTVKD